MFKDSLDLMKFKEKLQKALRSKVDPLLMNKLPSGYSIIGDIAIFHRINEELSEYKKIIGDSLIEINPRVSTVIEQVETRTALRRPEILHIAGERKTTTIHNEFNTVFKIDVNKLTFSPGNKGERSHLIKITEKEEIICDMFACIGNLSLPIAVNKPTVKVYGVEINKEAYDYLIENICLNKVEERYYPILGDNRMVTPKGIATRVLMGFFNIDIKQFEQAVDAINKEGWIHYHYTSSRESKSQVKDIASEVSKRMNFEVEQIDIRRIKKFSPRIEHMCADIKIIK